MAPFFLAVGGANKCFAGILPKSTSKAEQGTNFFKSGLVNINLSMVGAGHVSLLTKKQNRQYRMSNRGHHLLKIFKI
jgi:hypothetical protein